jgi:hypothetical protein
MIMVIILSFSFFYFSGCPVIWHARRTVPPDARYLSEHTPDVSAFARCGSVPPAGEAPAGSFWKQYIMFLCKINSFLAKNIFFIVRYHHIKITR